MKNRIAKILSAALALCLIICATLTITVFAAGSIDDARNSEGVYDFEGAPLGTITSGSKVVLAGTPTNVTHTIVEDDVNGKVFEWVKTKGTYAANDGIKFYETPLAGVNTVVLSFKMKIVAQTSNNQPVRISLYSGTTATVNVDIRKDGSALSAGGADITDYVESADDWFEFTIVYYEGDTEPTTTNKDLTCGGKASVFVNGNWVRDYETSALYRTHRAESVNNLNIGAVNATGMTVRFDDIRIQYKNIVTPEIISTNVSYGDYLYLYYAVPKATVPSDAAPKLIGSANGQSFETTKYTEDTVNGKECYIFRSIGIPAKELNTKITVQIVAGDAISDSLTYSVEDYLYQKLYNEGYIAETSEGVADIGKDDGKDFIRKNVYLNLLEYGYYTQQLLVENITDAIADVPYVSINGTTADFGGEAALGTEYTLNAVEGVSSFVVVTSDAFGKTITTKTAQAGETIAIEGFTLVYPVK